ncbi:RDD family protein [Dactylosporangium aurantiacum]|uniref:RDD family protein n=1 Tax=Dactylosporangium aurantiacum TaxID=35754 RepID=A0A9Q9IKD6_9ACTN|nr:RDD family protein [Dactylosporangium aurantiacum]MDG6100971.1 RDD family protein [Dactylosporangium aurantiacum]UWZ54979.1 RDD family protein [Dactylosporangium aurantiacum]
MTAPGWYKDPVDQTVQRYWDGDGWIGDPIPADAVPPAGPPAVAPPPPPPPPAAAPQMGAVILPPGTPVPPGGFPPGQLPPGAIVLPPGTPLPPGLQPQGTLPPGGYPSGAVQVLLPPQATGAGLGSAAMPHGRHVAGLGARLLARLVDIAVLLLINAAVTGWFVYQYLRESWPVYQEMYRRVLANESTGDIVQSERSGTLQVVILILIAALWFAYEVPAIANTGQTFGKRLLKIKVMRLESEDRIGYGRAIRRWNPLGLSVLLWTCGVGFVLQFLDSLSPVIDWPLHRAFHDRSAGTVVVRDVQPPSQPTGDAS